MRALSSHFHKWWFIALLVVNTFALLEILYIFVFSKREKKGQEGVARKLTLDGKFVSLSKEYKIKQGGYTMLGRIFLVIHKLFFPENNIIPVNEKKEPVFVFKKIDKDHIEITATNEHGTMKTTIYLWPPEIFRR